MNIDRESTNYSFHISKINHCCISYLKHALCFLLLYLQTILLSISNLISAILYRLVNLWDSVQRIKFYVKLVPLIKLKSSHLHVQNITMFFFKLEHNVVHDNKPTF